MTSPLRVDVQLDPVDDHDELRELVFAQPAARDVDDGVEVVAVVVELDMPRPVVADGERVERLQLVLELERARPVGPLDLEIRGHGSSIRRTPL
jgi:hypothetical protein